MKLFESGSIEKPIFSLYLRDESEVSKMIIGGYDYNSIREKGTKRLTPQDKHDRSKSDDGIFWMNINTDYYWQVNMYEAVIGGKPLKFASLADAVVNSDATVAYIP